MPYQRRRPITFSIEEYQDIENLISEIDDEDLTEREKLIRTKVRQIIRNKKSAAEFKARQERRENEKNQTNANN